MSKFTAEDMGDKAEDTERRFELVRSTKEIAREKGWDGPWRARYREAYGNTPEEPAYGNTADEAIDNLANKQE